MPATFATTTAGRARLLGLLGLQGGVIAVLHRLGGLDGFAIDWMDVAGWLAVTPVEDAVAAVGLTVARVLTGWLALSTIAYLAAARSGRPRSVRVWHRLTFPALRRFVALLVAVCAVTGPRVPATAAAPAHRMAETPGRERLILPPHLRAVPPGGGLEPGRRHVRVQPGDHLWGLSADHLRRVLGTDPTQRVIAGYWVRVVQANRPLLRSGNPDLVFPGEVVILPPV